MKSAHAVTYRLCKISCHETSISKDFIGGFHVTLIYKCFPPHISSPGIEITKKMWKIVTRFFAFVKIDLNCDIIMHKSIYSLNLELSIYKTMV